MNGLGKGSYKSEWVKKVILQEKIVPEFITKGPIETVVNALENPEDYDVLVPYITLIQSYASTNP